MAKKRPKKAMDFMKYLGIILVIITLIALGLIYFIGILPIEYFIALVILLLFIDLIIVKALWSKSIIKNMCGVLTSVGMMILLVFGITYEFNTIDFLKQLGLNNYKTENYNVIVLKSANFKTINDIENKMIARVSLLNREGLEKAIEKLENKIKCQVKELEDITDLTTHLINKKVDAILLEDTELNLIIEENPNIYDKLEIIDTIEVEIAIDNLGQEVDITKESFNLYITGIDTYGKITKVARSDVNIILTVNPKSREILITSIPRDYYVTLHKIGKKDKLTHAGIYGIETQIKTIEDLLDIKINYYAKFNFTSLINIVDSLGGITVESDYNFTTVDGFAFKKGVNDLNGEEALSFSRERQAFAEGDRIRGKNQIKVITSIIEKASSSTIIIKYNELIDALKGNIITNLSDDKIKDFIKKNIDNLVDYTITSSSLDGKNAKDYTYSYKNNKLYVMKPNEESITKAKEKIHQVGVN